MTEQVDTTDERWLPIPGYEGIYEASTFGRIKSFRSGVGTHISHKSPTSISGRILKCYKRRDGYCVVVLYKDKPPKPMFVHRIVAMTFIGACSDKYQVNHIDFNRANNRLDNLEWVTFLENQRHSLQRRMDSVWFYGEKAPWAKLTLPQALKIKEMRESGMTYTEIAKQMGVSRKTASNIVTGKRWRVALGEYLPHGHI